MFYNIALRLVARKNWTISGGSLEECVLYACSLDLWNSYWMRRTEPIRNPIRSAVSRIFFPKRQVVSCKPNHGSTMWQAPNTAPFQCWNLYADCITSYFTPVLSCRFVCEHVLRVLPITAINPFNPISDLNAQRRIARHLTWKEKERTKKINLREQQNN